MKGSGSVEDVPVVSATLVGVSFVLALVLGVAGLSVGTSGRGKVEVVSERGGPFAQADFEFSERGGVEDMVVDERGPVEAVVAAASMVRPLAAQWLVAGGDN